MNYADALKIWKDRNHGETRNVDPDISCTKIDDAPMFSRTAGGCVWIDGSLSIEELQALAVIGQEQMNNRDLQHSLKNIAHSVFQDTGIVIRLEEGPDESYYVTVRTKLPRKETSERFDDVMHAEEAFRQAVKKSVTNSERVREENIDVLYSVTVGKDAYTLEQYKFDKEYIIRKFNGSAHNIEGRSMNLQAITAEFIELCQRKLKELKP